MSADAIKIRTRIVECAVSISISYYIAGWNSISDSSATKLLNFPLQYPRPFEQKDCTDKNKKTTPSIFDRVVLKEISGFT
jgi:hypothetical protein